MSVMASQITGVSIVFSRLFRRRSKKTSKLRVAGLCEGWPVNSLLKGSITRKMFPFDDVIMIHVSVIISKHMLRQIMFTSNSCKIVLTEHLWLQVNIGSGNGLVPSCNQPLPEPMMTQIYMMWPHGPVGHNELTLYPNPLNTTNSLHQQFHPNEIYGHVIVNMVVADGLAPIWHQGISNNHADVGWPGHIKRVPTYIASCLYAVPKTGINCTE